MGPPGRGKEEPAMNTTPTNSFPLDCTGNVVAGDVIRFTEGVFSGSYRKPRFLGERTIEAKIIRDSYGGGRQQHTFTLRVIRSEGYDLLPAGQVIRRKGRNVYRNDCWRQSWADEAARAAACTEKHERGDAARTEREARLSGDPSYW